jgi:hypothetical protein
MVSNVKKQTIARLQFRAAHSLDFVSSRLRVFRDVRHSKSPLQTSSSFRDISFVGTSVGTFWRGPFDNRLRIPSVLLIA